MGFDIRALIDQRQREGSNLHSAHLNAQVPRMLGTIGFDRVLTHAEGSWYDDVDGNRYLDFLSGFGVFAVGRNHPVVQRAPDDGMVAPDGEHTEPGEEVEVAVAIDVVV